MFSSGIESCAGMESSIRDSWNFAAGESLSKIQDSSYLDALMYRDVLNMRMLDSLSGSHRVR